MVLQKNRKNPRQRPRSLKKISSGQQRIYLRIIICIVAFCLLWLLLAPGSGVLALFSKRAELNHAEEEVQRTEQENKILQGDIDKLLNDPEFLEEVARKEYNLLKKNEKVYDFSKTTEKTKE